MALNLERSIQRAYDGRFCYYYGRGPEQMGLKQNFIVIPLKEKDTIEIPTMALEKVMTENFCNTDYDSIVIPLTTRGYTCSYVSTEPMFKDVFCSKPAESTGLIRLKVKKGSQEFTYYGGGGAIFDNEFSPVLVTSWLFERVNGELKARKPILRISPVCFTRSNPLESFIVGKLLTQTLNTQMYSCYTLQHFFEAAYACDIRVVVEPIPFQIHSPNTPDINTTTQSLLDLVIDNQEEITCQ